MSALVRLETGGLFGARSGTLEMSSRRFTGISVEPRRLAGVDVNWVACYHENTAPGCQQSRASTRFP